MIVVTRFLFIINQMFINYQFSIITLKYIFFIVNFLLTLYIHIYSWVSSGRDYISIKIEKRFFNFSPFPQSGGKEKKIFISFQRMVYSPACLILCFNAPFTASVACTPLEARFDNGTTLVELNTFERERGREGELFRVFRTSGNGVWSRY